MSAERLEKGPVRPEEAERVRQIDIREARVLVVIPTIKGREVLLRRAIKSIREEDLLVAGAIEVDTEGRGPAYCRNLAVLSRSTRAPTRSSSRFSPTPTTCTRTTSARCPRPPTRQEIGRANGRAQVGQEVENPVVPVE